MRIRRAAAAGAASIAILAGASPAFAADATITSDDSFVFGNASPTIQVGEKVTWVFNNPGVQHNAVATSANWSFRSGDLSVNHGTHEFTFTAPGEYSYVCELHAPGMGGLIRVLAPGETPPPPGSPPPPPPGTPPPTQPGGPPPSVPAPGGSADQTEPRIRGAAMTRTRRTARVRFRLSETATVTVRLRGATRRTLRRQLGAGRRTVVVRGLRRSRYRIELQARDAAGNRSAWERAR